MTGPAERHSRRGIPLQTKLENWPPADRQLWEAAIKPQHLLSRAALAAKWRLTTIKTVAKCYGRWVAWLDREKLLDAGQRPEGRCTPSRIACYLDELHSSVASISAAGYLQGLAMALTRMSPAADLAWLWETVNVQVSQAQPSRCKRDRIVPVQALFALGHKLMEQDSKGDPLMDAIHFRDGLMIAFLAALPIRICNLHMMQVDRHLVCVGKGYDVRFAAAETKTHVELIAPVSPSLTDAINTYLELHRPILLRQATDGATRRSGAVWISRFGTQMAVISLNKRICELTLKEFGRSINPHLFRDCAATSIALDDPEHIQIIMGVLGHSSMTTSERTYNHALNRNAVALHTDSIASLRKRLAKRASQHERA